MNTNNRSLHYQTGLRIIILGIVTALVLFFFSISIQNSSGYAHPTPTAPRSITNTTLPLHEKWRNRNQIIPFRNTSVFYASNDLLIFVAYDSDGLTHWLNVLDTKNGSLLWKTDTLPFSEHSLAIDQHRLYLAISTKVLAYDLATGELLWESQEALPGRTHYRMYATGNQLIVYSAEDPAPGHTRRVVRVYDSQSGILKDMEDETFPEDAGFLLKTNSIDYWTSQNTLRSVDRSTRQEQWRIVLDKRVQYQPLLLENEFIFASGIFSDVIAINKNTGKQIWKYDKEIASNLSADSQTIYAIREDAAVVAINAFTGQEIGRINIAPNFTEGSGSRSIAYLVAAAKDMVFVYYEDSQEIIAFSK